MPLPAPTALSRRTMLVGILLAGTALVHPAMAQVVAERRVTLDEQTAVAVAIYNDDLALVRDSRRITLTQGHNKLALVDVSGRLRAETALLVAGGGATIRTLDDLQKAATMLAKPEGPVFLDCKLNAAVAAPFMSEFHEYETRPR